MMKKRFWILLCILFCSVLSSVLRFDRVSAEGNQRSVPIVVDLYRSDNAFDPIKVSRLFPGQSRIRLKDLLQTMSTHASGQVCLNTCVYQHYFSGRYDDITSQEDEVLEQKFLSKTELTDKNFYGGFYPSCSFIEEFPPVIEKDFFPILIVNQCNELTYSDIKNEPYYELKELIKIWAFFIDEKDPDAHMYERIMGANSTSNESNPPLDSSMNGKSSPIATIVPPGAPPVNWAWASDHVIHDNLPATLTATYALTLTQFAETQNVEITGTAAATETQIAGTGTAAATETQIAETAAAKKTQIAETASVATATAEAIERKDKEEKENRKKMIIAISIALGVIGLGAAVFLFIFTQRKRKAAYQMRFEQRRINAVPAPHLFDVEPKARPASAIPSGVSAGGEGNFERSITIEPAEELSDSATMEIDMGSSSVLRYDFGNIQHQGSREYQEDSFGFSDVADPNLVASRGILAVLADGMGGLKNGKSISERTVAKFRKAFMSFTPGVEVPRQLYSLVHETNAEIYQTDKQKGGTTLICVYIYGNSMYWVSVGDSAIYLFRQGRMYQLNREHNRLNDLYLRFMYREITKAQLLAEPTLQGLTSNIGRKELRDVDQNLRELRLRRGDRILLCSDGVSGRLTEKEMLVAMSQVNAQKCTDALKNFVLKKKAPKQDNLTAQVISCD